MFKVGDRVVHPMHGAGFVEGIVLQTIGGQPKEYYDVRIHGGNIRLKLPVVSMGSICLRAVIGKDEAAEVLRHFGALKIDVDAPWGKRYKENMEQLKTGDLKQVAEVVKALMMREKMVGLSTGDRQVLVMAKNIICSELSLALDKKIEEVQANLQTVIDKTLG